MNPQRNYYSSLWVTPSFINPSARRRPSGPGMRAAPSMCCSVASDQTYFFLSMCVCVYIYIYIYIYIYLYIYIYIYVCLSVCLSVCMYVCMYVSIYVCFNACLVYVCMQV